MQRAVKKHQQVLIYTQDPFYKDLIELTLKEYGYRARVTDNFSNLENYTLTIPTVAWFIDLDKCQLTPEEICQKARSIAVDARIVFLGSAFTREVVQSCLKVGAIAVLVKPFHVSRLVQTISLLCQEPVLLEKEEIIEQDNKPSSSCNSPKNDHVNLRLVNFTCPVCERKFNSYRFKMWFYPVGDTDTDFCPICPNSIHPELYSVVVCPNCLFAHYAGRFETQRYLEKQKKYFMNPVLEVERIVTAMKLDFCRERTLLHGVKSFELAALSCEQLQTVDRILLAGEFYLKASWLCRRMGHPKQERIAQEKALEKFTQLYLPFSHFRYKGADGRFHALHLSANREPLSDRQVIVIGFLCGELHRRLGNFKQAKKFFDDVIKFQPIDQFSSLATHINYVYRLFQSQIDDSS